MKNAKVMAQVICLQMWESSVKYKNVGEIKGAECPSLYACAAQQAEKVVFAWKQFSTRSDTVENLERIRVVNIESYESTYTNPKSLAHFLISELSNSNLTIKRKDLRKRTCSYFGI